MSRGNVPLICHVIVDLDVGGAELMLRRLVQTSQARSNFRHMVVSLTTIGDVGIELQAFGVEVLALKLKSAIGTPSAIWKLSHILRKFRPNIVQTWMYHADFVGGLAARLAGIPKVVWGIRTTDVSVSGGRATVALRRLCALLSSRVPEAIICAAEASRNLHLTLGYDRSRMIVVPNGFDFSAFDEASNSRNAIRAGLGLSEDSVVVGSLGRYNPVKDHRCLILAVSQLMPVYPQLRVMLVGRGLDSKNLELRELIAASGFADRFLLLGERQDAPNCLAAMDVFCLHSRTEGFPNVLAEAMAVGLPCVATDVGDAKAILGGGGRVVPSGNPPMLAEGLAQLLAMSRELLREMGMKGKVRVVAEYSMNRSCDKFEAVYSRLLAHQKDWT